MRWNGPELWISPLFLLHPLIEVASSLYLASPPPFQSLVTHQYICNFIILLIFEIADKVICRGLCVPNNVLYNVGGY